jgi:hypothetical protein
VLWALKQLLFDLHLPQLLGNKNVVCFSVADGISPRTGMLIAEETNWKVLSFVFF